MNNIKDLQKLSKDFTVLYAEDNSAIQISMVSYLNKLFKKVLTANDGVEGLNLYKKENVNIVITDLSMPRMNGLDMISEMKKIDENQAILITSAHNEAAYMFEAIKIGIDGYIIKPFDYTQLNNELLKIVKRLQQNRENIEYKKHLSDMVEKRTLELSNMILYQSNNYKKTLQSMVDMIEERDTYTAGHSRRVAKYSKMIAKDMGYSDEECTKIYQAGILHDVGKVATPDAVLLNPKSLNEIEYTLIKEHVSVSYRLLKGIPMFEELASIVHAHHEKYDGTGYPKGLKKDEIYPLSKIMIVADAFDAMTTNRIYKARKSVEESLQELKDYSSKQFHPEIVEVAIESLKDVKIDESINQLPKTKLEEERFAYFYKDILTDTYNDSYLDLIISKNSLEKDYNYKYLYKINLKKFSIFNKDYGWEEGNKVLKLFASSLIKLFKDEPVFRILGDDFAVLCGNKKDVDLIKNRLDNIATEYKIEYEIETYDLDDFDIDVVYKG